MGGKTQSTEMELIIDSIIDVFKQVVKKIKALFKAIRETFADIDYTHFKGVKRHKAVLRLGNPHALNKDVLNRTIQRNVMMKRKI